MLESRGDALSSICTAPCTLSDVEHGSRQATHNGQDQDLSWTTVKLRHKDSKQTNTPPICYHIGCVQFHASLFSINNIARQTNLKRTSYNHLCDKCSYFLFSIFKFSLRQETTGPTSAGGGSSDTSGKDEGEGSAVVNLKTD